MAENVGSGSATNSLAPLEDLPLSSKADLLESSSRPSLSCNAGGLVFGEDDQIESNSPLSHGEDSLDLSRVESSSQILAGNGNYEATSKGGLDHEPGYDSVSVDNPQPHISTETCRRTLDMDRAKAGDQLTDSIPEKEETANEPKRKAPTDNDSSAINGGARGKPALKRQTFFMVKLPRNPDAQLRSKIKLAELQLEEASKNKDIIRAALQLKRASKMGLLDKLKVKWEKERACKDAVQRKRMEIDPLQHALDQFKKAENLFREEDYLEKEIANLQHRIQHESIPLKEEKQLVRRIKNLELQRKDYFANDTDHAQLLNRFGSKEVVEEQFDILQKELDLLRAEQHEARLECIPTENELEDVNVKMDDLVEQLEKAKHAHGAAFAALKEFKRSLAKLNSDFYMNKEDFRRARELASSHNVEELAAFCHQQVEGVLTRWNHDDSFRERYMKNSEYSTVRRLETLEGRSLGRDEEPPLLTSDVDMNMVSSSMDNGPASKVGPEEALQKPECADKKVKLQQAGKVALGVSKGSQDALAMDSKGSHGKTQTSKARVPPASSVVAVVEEPPPTNEDAASKAARAAEAEEKQREEELAREREATELKEKRRQGEIAKAKEAAERKKRQAERAQAKAQLRAEREVERRDKEREKKARKKAMVATEGLKPTEESPQEEERDTDPVLEELPPVKEAGKRSSSSSRARGFGPKLTKRPQRPPTINMDATRRMSTLPFVSMWMWVLLLSVIIVAAIMIVVLAKL